LSYKSDHSSIFLNTFVKIPLMRFFSLLMVLSLSCGDLFSQTTQNNPFTPGTCGINSGAKVDGNLSPQNGNGSLGATYNLVKCGLNFTQVSVKLGQRYSISCCPSTPGVPQPATFAISGIPSCAVIERAYLWAGTSGNGIAINASVTNPMSNNQVFPMAIVGTDQDKCWSFTGTYTYRADVTSIISGNGNYIISGFPTSTNQSGNDTDGATLMIIYSVPTATYQGQIHIWDGCWVGIGQTFTTNLTGFNACAASTTGTGFIVSADHQQLNSSFVINGSAPFQIGAQENWYNYISAPVNITANQNSSNFQVQASGDCFNWMIMGLYFQTNTCVTCTPQNTNMTLTSTFQDAQCNQCNGTATVTPSGGVSPYTYQWNTTPVQTTQTATGLCAGTYIVSVNDATGCATGVDTIIIQTIGGVNVTAANADVLCFGGSTGSATATPQGGQSPYTYSWSTTPAQTTAVATGLAAGTYTVTITDGMGCTSTTTVTINQPLQLTATANLVNDALCNGSSDGAASVTGTGGTGSLSYAWSTSPVQTTANATGLSMGTYIVMVTDANGCTATSSVTINQPTPLQTSIFFDAANCGMNDGQSTVIATGATGPYSFSWSTTPPQTTATATGLSVGVYTCTVTDANGCTSTIAVNVIDTASPVANFVANPSTVYITNPVVFFTDLSLNASTWYWNFGDPGDTTSSSLQHPVHTFSDTGTFCIWLFISNTVCTDSFQVCIRVLPETQLFVPNAFTPNGDGKNDLFMPLGVYVEEFQMWIFDRWGDMIFTTTDMRQGWDGKANGGAKIAQEDVYVWVINYTDNQNRKIRKVGHVSLIR
jgi:gliding motility-associated-like protein